MRSTIFATSLLALAAAACSDATSAADLNKNPPPVGGTSSGGNSSTPTSGSSNPTPTAGTAPGGGTGTVIPEGGSGGTGQVMTGGTGGAGPSGGTGSDSGGSGGSGGMMETGPFAPRSGKFKMLVYSKTAGFRHTEAIAAGKTMLTQIATEIGIDPPTVTEENSWLNSINDYELVFFMNPTGDIFNNDEQTKFQTWMDEKGAFCGTHSATDTEAGWPYYSEVTGQYYDGHGMQNTQDSIQIEPTAANHPILVGVPNPWQRREEWYKFNSFQQWTAKEGFTILGRKAADGQPIVWTRQYKGFRSFYNAIGHAAEVFQDPVVKKHITAGILWSVRREHCLATPKPGGCP